MDWSGDLEVSADAFGQADQGAVDSGVLLHFDRDVPEVILDGCKAGREQGEGFLASLESAGLEELHGGAGADAVF